MEAARIVANRIGINRRHIAAASTCPVPAQLTISRMRTQATRRTRRDALEGYVVCLELGEATIIAEGGQFSFQVPSSDLQIGNRVWFVRAGDQFELV